MTNDIIAVQKRFEGLQHQYLKLQQSKSKLVDLLHENELVLEDMKTLKPECSVYQTVGPTLLPRSHDEVRSALTEKVGFIRKQLEVANKQLQDLEGQLREINKERMQIARNRGAVKGAAAGM
ncbi:Prefoldin subunit family protein [Giardia duodenalis]|uniref:Prefoldin subunit family protein n=1 Tax=Giardia intestinalis TaxID=5741 RepID=V6TJ49_GIAIN|nr:Prefoldin subunit family protein [Giardia intestinalis]